VTKLDLIEMEEDPEPWSFLKELEIPVYPVCAKKGIGLDALRGEVEGRRVVFAGQSGVGKTYLLNQLVGTSIGKVGALSSSTGRGKHTTTSAIQIPGVGEGAFWIDTPGVKEFAILPDGLDLIPKAIRDRISIEKD
jgi:ribosome biogenesis GTPase